MGDLIKLRPKGPRREPVTCTVTSCWDCPVEGPVRVRYHVHEGLTATRGCALANDRALEVEYREGMAAPSWCPLRSMVLTIALGED